MKRPFLLNFYIYFHCIVFVFVLGIDIYLSVKGLNDDDNPNILVSLIDLAYQLLFLIIIFGLWNLKPWARKLALLCTSIEFGFVFIISFAVALPNFMSKNYDFLSGWEMSLFYSVLAYLLINLYILLRKEVKQAFYPVDDIRNPI